MKLFIKVRPGARKNKVQKVDEINFVISVTAQPEKDRANRAAVQALADYLNIPSTRIRISAGLTARHKIFEILWGQKRSS